MKKRTQNYLPGSVVALVALIGISTYSASAVEHLANSASVGAKLHWDSKMILNEFFVQSQAGNFMKAHALLTKDLGKQLTVPVLTKDWKAFERAHGPLKNWQASKSRGDGIYIGPDYVQSTYKVTGKKSGAGKVIVRMVKENGNWKIGQLNISA